MIQTKGFGCVVLRHNFPRTHISSRMRSSASNVGSKTLFVGGISNRLKEEELLDAFSPHGEVVEARICFDPRSGCSMGYGFLKYSSVKEAEVAMRMMNGKVLEGRRIRVTYAVSEPK